MIRVSESGTIIRLGRSGRRKLLELKIYLKIAGGAFLLILTKLPEIFLVALQRRGERKGRQSAPRSHLSSYLVQNVLQTLARSLHSEAKASPYKGFLYTKHEKRNPLGGTAS